MKIFIFFFIFIFCFINCFSQKRYDHWYFGFNGVLNFDTNPPTSSGNSSIHQLEGSASISDNITGELLFYTDGITIWNRNHVVMLNGTGLNGDYSSTQSALIVPKPGDNNIYYVFTVPQENDPGPSCYSIIDMTLDGGLGAVTLKNVSLHAPVTEKLTATPNSNNTGYWIVTKEFGTDAFFVYSLTSAGLNPNPVISHIGFTPTTSADRESCVKISHAGSKLCAAYPFSHLAQLFDFDNNTGTISNLINLVFPALDGYSYGVEFSPDDSKLYLSFAFPYYIIKQYDLFAGSPIAIQNSLIEIIHVSASGTVAGTIMLGPDNKIYIADPGTNHLSVIDQPNLPGAACHYLPAAIQLSPNSMVLFGLPNNINHPIISACVPTQNINSNATICSNQDYQLPWGTIVNTSGIYNDTIRNSPGTCDSIITSINLSLFPVSNVNSIAQICSGQTYQLPSGTIVNTSGVYLDTLRSVGSCDSVITTMNLSVFPVSNVSSTAHICLGQTYQLPSGTIVNTTGVYLDTLRSVGLCDSIIATVHLSVFPVKNINSIVQICTNQTYQLPSGTIVGTAGIYIDTAKSMAGCDSVITNLNMSVFPITRLNTAVQMCSNDIYHLPSGTIVNTSGIYLDTLKSVAGCDSIINTTSILISEVSSSNIVDSIYEGQSYVLPSGQTVNTSGVYQTVLLNSLGCDSVITTTLKLKKQIAECLTLKNAFTPNGDGINDYWVLYKYNCFKKLEVNVYNRYGSLVYHSENYKNDWMGTYKNKPLPDGTYYYVIKVISLEGKVYVFKDNVTILR